MKTLSAEKLLEEIDLARVPAHIAVIMDGNGRWAQSRGLPRIEGHRKGAEVVRDIVEAANDIGIKILTLYTFSTENWKRPKKEVLGLMSLLRNYLKKETPELRRKNVKLGIVGELSKIPLPARKQLRESIDSTAAGTGLLLNLALNYGSRTEIVEAVKKIASGAARGKLNPSDISEESFGNYLYTAGMSDPDLLIRTGGDIRVSNFLLWQISYSELYFERGPWPEFTRADFYRAVLDYQKRRRKFGRVA